MQTVVRNWPGGHNGNGLYVTEADAYHYARGKSSNGTTYAVTKNTTQVAISLDCLAQAVYNSFDPPAELLRSEGIFYAPCNATIHNFGIQIGDTVFYMSSDDLLRQTARDSGTKTLCHVGATDSDSEPHVLGASFLSNAVAVFDVGNGEMRFASRHEY